MIRYFVSTQFQPPTVLRRTESATGQVDEAFIDGTWRPTKTVIDYEFGHDDFVDGVSEAVARETAPEAFMPPA